MPPCAARDEASVAQNDARAIDPYRRATDQNNGSALNNPGWMHENGRGVPVD